LTEYHQVVALLDDAEKRLDELGQQSQNTRLLDTMPGLGQRTAEAIDAYLHDPGRLHSGKHVSAYIGMVPHQYQSGETDRRGRITRRGPALLRKLLVQCAWAMLRYNVWARSVWLRLTHGGKVQRKQAIVALARKILVRAWAMLRDQTPWHESTLAPVGV
jgi:transposase